MPKLRISVLVFCFVVFSCILSSEVEGKSGGKGYSRQYRQIKAHGYYNGAEDPYARPTPTAKVQKARGPGISGWGIIAIALSIILLGFAVYYFYLFYPIFCKTERQYNTIELVNV